MNSSFSRMFLKSLFVFSVGVTGCTHIVVNRMGARVPPKPPNCEISFEYLNLQDFNTVQKYQLVGTIGLSGNIPDEFTPEVMEKLRPDACRLGADVVSLMGHGSSSSVMGSGASYGVYVRKTSQSASP